MAKFTDYPLATAVTNADRLLAVQDGVNKQVNPDNISGLMAVGVNQTWQDVTASRSSGVIYYNTTGKPIQVNVSGYNNSTSTWGSIAVNGVTSAIIHGHYNNATRGDAVVIVPPGAGYMVSGLVIIQFFGELKL